MNTINAEAVRKYSERHGCSFIQAKAALIENEKQALKKTLIERVRYATSFEDLKQAIIFLLEIK